MKRKCHNIICIWNKQSRIQILIFFLHSSGISHEIWARANDTTSWSVHFCGGRIMVIVVFFGIYVNKYVFVYFGYFFRTPTATSMHFRCSKVSFPQNLQILFQVPLFHQSANGLKQCISNIFIYYQRQKPKQQISWHVYSFNCTFSASFFDSFFLSSFHWFSPPCELFPFSVLTFGQFLSYRGIYCAFKRFQ